MPRLRKPWWNKRDSAYFTKIDGRQVMLRHPSPVPGRPGPKVGHLDESGVRAAMERLLAERDAAIRRSIDPSVTDVCREYLIASAVENTMETMVGKEWVLSKWCAFGSPPHGERPAREIDSTHLHRMRKEWEKAGYSPGMLRRLYREVMACWAWASRPEPERVPLVILEKNPLARMRQPAARAGKAKYVPMPAVRALIAHAEARAGTLGPVMARFERQAALMLRLLAETGCRPKEACSALWADFNEAEGVIVLDPDRHKTGRKTGKRRVIVVSMAIVAELAALRDSGYAHPTHLFAHKRSRGASSLGAERETGAPWARPSYTAWFLRLVREAASAWKGQEGAPVLPEGLTLYWLRHSYLTDAQQTAGSEKAADLAGNTKEIARDTYLHNQIQGLRDTADRVAEQREGTK
jgi:integrase